MESLIIYRGRTRIQHQMPVGPADSSCYGERSHPLLSTELQDGIAVMTQQRLSRTEVFNLAAELPSKP